MIKAIIFDMGGVLVDLDVEACKEAYRRDLGYERIDSILDACHQKGVFGAMEAGEISADEFRQAILAESREDARPEDVDAALSHILVGIAPYKGELLRKLSKAYDVYMLSNNNPIATPMARELFEKAGFSMDRDFKKCYISYQMKMMKPSVEFFKAVIEDIGLPGEEMLFIDDSHANVEAAERVGLQAAYYEQGSDLEALIRGIVDIDGGGMSC